MIKLIPPMGFIVLVALEDRERDGKHMRGGINSSMKLRSWIATALVMCGCGGSSFDYDPSAGQAPGADASATDPHDVATALDAAPTLESADAATADADAGVDVGRTEAGEASAPTGCTLVTHTDGAGDPWADCLARGTYSASEAFAACLAWQAAHPEYGPDTPTGHACLGQSPNNPCAPSIVYTATNAPDAGSDGIIGMGWIYVVQAGTLGAAPGDVIRWVDPWPGLCQPPAAIGHWE